MPPTPPGEQVRVLAFNVRKVDETGPGREWGPIAAAITAHAPHVVLLQELDGTTGKPLAANGRPQLGAAVDTRQADRLGQALGMRIRIADAPHSAVHTAIAYRPDLELLHWEELVGPPFHHGQSLAVLQSRRWEHPVTFASVHLSPRSVFQATEEFRHMAEPLRQHTPYLVSGGDYNTPTLTDTLRGVDWAALPPHNRTARLLPGPGHIPNLELDHVLRHADLLDAAEHLYHQDRDPARIAATGKGGLRVDRFHISQETLSWLADCGPVDGHGLSDHTPLLLTLHIPTMRTRQR